MKFNSIYQECFLYFYAVILTGLILACIFYAPGFDISFPQQYGRDYLFTGTVVKTIIDSGWVLNNAYLGAPLNYNFADYPQAEVANFFIIKMLSSISANYVVVINYFYFLTFPLVALFSLFTFRYLGINKIFSLVASLLFAFLPYHFIRGENHLLLNAYYVVPIYVLFIFSVFSTQAKLFSFRQFLFYVIACAFAASSGVYYAFFACYFLILAGLFASIEKKKWQPFLKAVILIFLISVTLIINISPGIASHMEHGPNKKIGKRASDESEKAGLKIAQLLLPVDQHRIGIFKHLKRHYDHTAPLVNENTSASLGIIGSIGFLFLIAFLFIRNRFSLSDKLFIFSQLNLCAVLLATVGGFSSIFAYLITPTIRSYNRISVFIAFFAFYAFFVLLQNFLKKRTPQNYIRNCTIIAILLLPVGILDQVGKVTSYQNYAQIKADFTSDEKFIAEIEKRMPVHSMIFQLPVAGFPENPIIVHMADYQLSRAYLHSHYLHWSYGAMQARPVLAWQKEVSKKPLKLMVNELIDAGFTGIFLDREGFEDNGMQIEKKLTQLLGQKSLVSDDEKFVFYDLRNYAAKLR